MTAPNQAPNSEVKSPELPPTEVENKDQENGSVKTEAAMPNTKKYSGEGKHLEQPSHVVTPLVVVVAAKPTATVTPSKATNTSKFSTDSKYPSKVPAAATPLKTTTAPNTFTEIEDPTEESDKTEKLYCTCKTPWNPNDPSFMIECHNCHDWFHGECVNVKEIEASKFEKWNCPNCIPYVGPPQLIRGLRKRKKIDFASLNEAPVDNSGAVDMIEVDYASRLKVRTKANLFLDGSKCVKTITDGVFSPKFTDIHGFQQPVLFPKEAKAQLGLKVPPGDFGVSHVAKLGGGYRTLDVIDVATQCTLECSLREWAGYLKTPTSQRDRILNIISFEFSRTPLNELVTPPQFVRDVDFVNAHWPSDDEDNRPRVSKYCLMGSEGSFTDFHVDFGGTSVWYHVFKGEKMFYFIRPTPQNLAIYAEWSTNGKQSQQFLGDLVTECYNVQLTEGCTLLIPSGWIHAVYTPQDSLVFGGNFVHKYSLDMQLKIFNLERKMRVAKQYKFPNYEKLMWHSASDFCKSDFEEIKAQPLHILRGYKALAMQLRKWLRSERTHKSQFPTDMNVPSLVDKLEAILGRFDLRSPKLKTPSPIEKGTEQINLKKTRKKKRKIEENDFWAQCDVCDEWRKVSREPDKGAAFSCQDAKRKCRTKPSLWVQCEVCEEWYIVDRQPEERFTCKDVNEQCSLLDAGGTKASHDVSMKDARANCISQVQG